MQKGRGKEMLIEVHNNYNVRIGTVDNKNPVAVYIKISAWGEAKGFSPDVNYGTAIKKLNKTIKSHLFNTIDSINFHNDLTIVDLDMRESGISPTKRSFMSCEITLFQTDNYQIHSEYMISQLSSITTNLIEEVFDSNDKFDFYQKKN